MSRTTGGAAEVGLHWVLADWQEGQAAASGQGEAGAAAGQGDVTWTQRVFDTLAWTTAGGDFSPVASASATVAGFGSYTWESTSQLVADVQGWLDDPDSDHGWLLQGDKSKTRTAKRFHSDENDDEAIRPVLMVEYTQ